MLMLRNLASVKKVCIYQPFPQNVVNAKFEQKDGHGKPRNGHEKYWNEIFPIAKVLAENPSNKEKVC